MINAVEKIDYQANAQNKILQDAERFKDYDKFQTRDTALLGLKENEEGLKKVASEFEGMFIGMLLREMRKTVNNEDGMLPPSSESKIYQEMLDTEIAKKLSQKQSLGIANSVIKAYEKNLHRDNTFNTSTSVKKEI